MVKKIRQAILNEIAIINASVLTAKEKELMIDALLKLKVQRNEDIVIDE